MRKFRIPVLGMHVQLFDRGESVLNFHPALYGKLIRGENSARPQSMSGPRIPSVLRLGKLRDDWFQHEITEGPNGLLLSRRVVTDSGVSFLATDWLDSSKDVTNFNAHGCGTGTTAEAASQTALTTEVETRVSGTKTKPTAPQLQSVGTQAMTATRAITEHGLFDSTTVGGSTMWDRSLFSAINVVNGDSIQFTYTVTISSGG